MASKENSMLSQSREVIDIDRSLWRISLKTILVKYEAVENIL